MLIIIPDPLAQFALTRNGCWHTPHSTVSVPKLGTCTCRWTVQVGQATSRIFVLDPCVGADEFDQDWGPRFWFVSAPHEGQRETLPVTNEMLPHLLQFRTEVPDDVAAVPFRLLSWLLLLLSAFLPAFRSSSSWRVLARSSWVRRTGTLLLMSFAFVSLCVTSARQRSQTRTTSASGSAVSVVLPRVQLSQNTSPQFLQWCRRLKKAEKTALQLRQLVAASSGTQCCFSS